MADHHAPDPPHSLKRRADNDLLSSRSKTTRHGSSSTTKTDGRKNPWQVYRPRAEHSGHPLNGLGNVFHILPYPLTLLPESSWKRLHKLEKCDAKYVCRSCNSDLGEPPAHKHKLFLVAERLCWGFGLTSRLNKEQNEMLLWQVNYKLGILDPFIETTDQRPGGTRSKDNEWYPFDTELEMGAAMKLVKNADTLSQQSWQMWLGLLDSFSTTGDDLLEKNPNESQARVALAELSANVIHGAGQDHTSNQKNKDHEMASQPSDSPKVERISKHRTLPDFYAILDNIERTSYVGAQFLEAYADHLQNDCCTKCWFTRYVTTETSEEEHGLLLEAPKAREDQTNLSDLRTSTLPENPTSSKPQYLPASNTSAASTDAHQSPSTATQSTARPVHAEHASNQDHSTQTPQSSTGPMLTGSTTSDPPTRRHPGNRVVYATQQPYASQPASGYQNQYHSHSLPNHQLYTHVPYQAYYPPHTLGPNTAHAQYPPINPTFHGEQWGLSAMSQLRIAHEYIWGTPMEELLTKFGVAQHVRAAVRSYIVMTSKAMSRAQNGSLRPESKVPSTQVKSHNTSNSPSYHVPVKPQLAASKAQLKSSLVRPNETDASDTSIWLKTCYEEDLSSEMTQVELWNAYKDYRKQHPSGSGTAPEKLTGDQFIHVILTIFPSAKSKQTTVGGVTKYTVHGIRVRSGSPKSRPVSINATSTVAAGKPKPGQESEAAKGTVSAAIVDFPAAGAKTSVPSNPSSKGTLLSTRLNHDYNKIAASIISLAENSIPTNEKSKTPAPSTPTLRADTVIRTPQTTSKMKVVSTSNRTGADSRELARSVGVNKTAEPSLLLKKTQRHAPEPKEKRDGTRDFDPPGMIIPITRSSTHAPSSSSQLKSPVRDASKPVQQWLKQMASPSKLIRPSQPPVQPQNHADTRALPPLSTAPPAPVGMSAPPPSTAPQLSKEKPYSPPKSTQTITFGSPSPIRATQRCGKPVFAPVGSVSRKLFGDNVKSETKFKPSATSDLPPPSTAPVSASALHARYLEVEKDRTGSSSSFPPTSRRSGGTPHPVSVSSTKDAEKPAEERSMSVVVTKRGFRMLPGMMKK